MKKLIILFLNISLLCTVLTGCFYGTSGLTENTRPATDSDIVVRFKGNSNLFSANDYYIEIQAQEEIKALSLSVDYLSSSGVKFKTETIYVGKVVPGNTYEFKLSLNNMNPSDLNKISKFAYRIDSGTVIL